MTFFRIVREKLVTLSFIFLFGFNSAFEKWDGSAFPASMSDTAVLQKKSISNHTHFNK
jgi:hypothetical protein